MDAKGQTWPLNWANGLDGLRLFITASSRSAPIESAHDIFQLGDLIRIKKQKGFVQLAQLPTAQAAMVPHRLKKAQLKHWSAALIIAKVALTVSLKRHANRDQVLSPLSTP